MAWLIAVAVILAACFGLVLLRGAPYLPTLNKQVDTALDMAGLMQGQTLLELGCGDGKVLIAAAERGWKVVGYELNPILAAIAWLRTRKYQGRVRVICGDFWRGQWPPHDAIFVFLLDSFMPKLDTKIVQSISNSSKSTAKPAKPLKLVSFAFQVPGREPKTERNGLYLYEYK